MILEKLKIYFYCFILFIVMFLVKTMMMIVDHKLIKRKQ